eukprot:TRINITY_DN6969_c0_g2_i1.p3 TRINITY_DN6969_c0_g2~~TRINITY_DN6969_c0_g2_i1.p3  ORF type:complete len:104 (-),score=21.43 TRINITY_DN6969_c0_g2_i1:731-1042(-)
MANSYIVSRISGNNKIIINMEADDAIQENKENGEEALSPSKEPVDMDEAPIVESKNKPAPKPKRKTPRKKKAKKKRRKQSPKPSKGNKKELTVTPVRIDPKVR